MEQIDRLSFMSQIFWLFILFMFLYFLVLLYIIPKVHKSLRFRFYLYRLLKRKLAKINTRFFFISYVLKENLKTKEKKEKREILFDILLNGNKCFHQ